MSSNCEMLEFYSRILSEEEKRYKKLQILYNKCITSKSGQFNCALILEEVEEKKKEINSLNINLKNKKSKCDIEKYFKYS